MTPFRIAHASAADWARASKACVDQLGLTEGHPYTLGFVYATDLLAPDLSSVLTFLRETTRIEHWVGSVGLGVCASGQDYFDRSALAVMVCDFPADSFRVFGPLERDALEIRERHGAWIDRIQPPFAVVHADARNPDTPALISGMTAGACGFLAGGLTSSRGPMTQVAGRVVEGGLSGVLMAPEIAVATGLSQGCTPLGAVHRVTEARDGVVMALDDRLALDVLKEDVGELLARDLRRVAGYIHAALPVENSDTADYLVRNLIAIDPARGWLAIGEELAPGDRLMFVRRDANAARHDLRRMVGDVRRRAPAARGGLYVSCVARGPHMFGDDGGEMRLIAEALGDDVPLVGFYAGGEISRDRLYGYTGVLVLFP